MWYEEYADTHFFSAVGTVFFNKILAPFLNRPADPNAVQEALDKRLPEMFSYLDKEIGSKEFLTGNKLSIADISVYAPFLNLEFTDYELDASKWPALARYINTIAKQPQIEKVTARAKERYKVRFNK